MIRALSFIEAAIRVACPEVSQAVGWAPHIRQLADEHSFDPVTMIAIVEGESHCRASVVNVRGQERYVGLSQIRVRNFSACSGKLEDATCQQVEASLKQPLYNLTTAARYITMNRGFCREKVGSALFAYWLASFQGFNDRTKRRFCGHQLVRGRWQPVKRAKLTSKVMQRRLELIRKVERGRRR